MSKQPPTRTYCKRSRPLPYCNPNKQDAPALEVYPAPSHHPTTPDVTYRFCGVVLSKPCLLPFLVIIIDFVILLNFIFCPVLFIIIIFFFFGGGGVGGGGNDRFNIRTPSRKKAMCKYSKYRRQCISCAC